MKKMIHLLTTVLIITSIMSCGCSDTSTLEKVDVQEDIHQADVLEDTSRVEDSVETPAPDPSAYSCNWDWEFYTTKTISYSTAPVGYTYAVCTFYLQNNAVDVISTNPWYWALVANGVAYDHDSVTYSDSISHNTVVVGQGGEFETQLVFQVLDNVETASLVYKGPNVPYMNRIDHYGIDETVSEDVEHYDVVLAEVRSSGHNITRLEEKEVYENGEYFDVLDLHVDDIEPVKDIFEIADLAFWAGSKPDRYVMVVDGGNEYWITKSDVRTYNSKPLNYEEELYVNFPMSRKVRLEDLSREIKEMMD